MISKELSEILKTNLDDTNADYVKEKKSQKEIVKTIYGKRFTGDWSVRECMNKIVGRTLTDDEFDHFYPLYTLGYHTGRCVGLVSKKSTLEYLVGLSKPKKAKNSGVD